eukprot:3128809-Rhodomonas_salina.1
MLSPLSAYANTAICLRYLLIRRVCLRALRAPSAMRGPGPALTGGLVGPGQEDPPESSARRPPRCASRACAVFVSRVSASWG